MPQVKLEPPKTENIEDWRTAFFSLSNNVEKLDDELEDRLRLIQAQNEKVREYADFKTAFISILEDLDETLRQRTLELELATRRLLELDKTKDEFLSIASHEMRTPMTAIKGYVDMILAGDSGSINETTRSFLQEVAIAIDRQIRLVNDLLNISRIETGRISVNIEVIKLEELIRQVIKELNPVAAEKGIKLYLKLPEDNKELPQVRADADKVAQILHNLLGNALKFTDVGEVFVEVVPKIGEVIAFVSDTGSGIKEEFQADLFQKFHRITPKRYTAKGTGLGLYISKKIAQLMGGDVWLEKSVEGEGTTFGIKLPTK